MKAVIKDVIQYVTQYPNYKQDFIHEINSIRDFVIPEGQGDKMEVC